MNGVIEQDMIVEDRQWRHGVEIVSHVNHSQIARVRAVLGLMLEPWRSTIGVQPAKPRLLKAPRQLLVHVLGQYQLRHSRMA